MANATERSVPEGEAPLLQVEKLVKRFPVRGGVPGRAKAFVHAVDGVSFTLHAGETLGIVGESGCGKSTLAAHDCRSDPARHGNDPSSRQNDLWPVAARECDRSGARSSSSSRIRMPRSIRGCVQEPSSARRSKISPASADANLPTASRRYSRASACIPPRSTNTRTSSRAANANDWESRAGSPSSPSLIVADEPVSALDVSVQAQVINLMMDLQKEFGLAYLFIAHDLAVVQHISHRVAVMYLGRIVELASQRSLFSAPLHPYTEALLNSVPLPDPATRSGTQVLAGEVPSPIGRHRAAISIPAAHWPKRAAALKSLP